MASGGIIFPPRRKSHSTFRFLFSSPPDAIISPLSHHICLPFTPFDIPNCHAFPPNIHLPPPSPSSWNICRPPSTGLGSGLGLGVRAGASPRAVEPWQGRWARARGRASQGNRGFAGLARGCRGLSAATAPLPGLGVAL